MSLVFATHNGHKIEEVQAILEGSGVQLRGLSDWPELAELEESGETFEACAEQKARAVYLHTGLTAVADDSGLEVEALSGAPGVRSKRFSPEQTAEANNKLLLSRLEGVSNRRARFRCVVAIVGPFGTRLVSGECAGTIALAPEGTGGFGYDPLFVPDEAGNRTMAQLSGSEKNALSHRGRAFRQLAQALSGLGVGEAP